MNQFYRHGDVLLVKVNSSDGAQLHEGSSYIVAYGEATGHTHTLSTETKNGIRVFETTTGERYLDLSGKARLSHQEHKTIEIDPGIYRVVTEREHDYFAEESRRVTD